VRTWIVVVIVAVLTLAAFVMIRRAARAIEAKLLYHVRPLDKFTDAFQRGNGAVKSYTVPFSPPSSSSSSRADGATGDLRYLALVPDECVGTVIIFHGNAGTAEEAMRAFGPRLHRMNYAAFTPEYPGYAGDKSNVKPSEALLLAHAVQFLDHVISTGHLPAGKPVLVLGHSLGGAVAVHVASARPADVHGALLVAPISSVAAVASARVPYVPFHWFVHDNFDACAWARRVVCPVTVLSGTDDVIVPPRVSEHLARSFPVPPRVLTMQRGTHNDMLTTHATQVWQAVQSACADAAEFHEARTH
jgi:hypothetical protein